MRRFCGMLKVSLLFLAKHSALDIFGLSIDALEMAEECMEEISNDLHMYYVEQLKNPNYAQRLGKMSKMISDVRVGSLT